MTTRQSEPKNEYETELTRRLEQNPADFLAWEQLGDYYRQTGDYANALASLDRAIRLAPRSAVALADRGDVHRLLGEYDAALADLNTAVLSAPSYAWAIATRGETYRLMGDYQQAIDDLNRAVELWPDDAWARACRGETLRLIGKYQQALDDLNQATTDPNRTDGATLAWAATARSQTHRLLGDYENALKDLDYALRVQPDYPWAQDSRDEIAQQKRTLGVLDIRPRATPDVPATTDLLGFAPLVKGLYALLNSEETKLPLAIAITAPWGSGKSSVMLQLKDNLSCPANQRGTTDNQSSRRWYTVWLDAWKYEKSERLWAALAKEVYGQSQAQMNLVERVWFRLSLERRRRGALALLIQSIGFPVLLAAVLAAIGILGTVVWQWGASEGVPRDIASKVAAWTGGIGVVSGVVAALTRLWGVASDPFKRSIDRHVARPKYEEQLGFTGEADRDISYLIKSLTDAKNRALAIFVDDLDRCSSSHVVEVVEAVNQIFNSGSNESSRECVFVLGMDRQAVAASINAEYKHLFEYLKGPNNSPDDYGLRFLSKIVQMSVAVPPPSPKAMQRLLARITGSEPPSEQRSEAVPIVLLEDIAEELRKAPGNPSDVRRRRIVLEDSIEAPHDGPPDPAGRPELPLELPEVVHTLRALPPDQRQVAIEQAEQIVRAERFTTDSEDVKNAEFNALSVLDRNPRQLKRFDNAFRLQLHVASGTLGNKLDFGPDQLAALAKWVAIRLRWPGLAEDLDREEGLLKALENYANAPDNLRETPKPECSRWFSNELLLNALGEENTARRLTSLPLDTGSGAFLRVA
jgi:tetratricopeptide (TPR) repeat protein